MAALRLAAVAAASLSLTVYAVKAPQSTAQETLNVLDKDGSGWVELEEIQDFAKSQGLTDSNSVLAEFQGLDRDGNGKLDASELEGMLALSEESAPAEPTNVATSDLPSLEPMSSELPVPALPTATAPELAMPHIAAMSPSEANSFVGSAPRSANLAAEEFQQQKQEEPQREHQPSVPASAEVQHAGLPQKAFESATSWLQASATSAERLAIRAAAEVFAKHAQQVLALRGQEEQQAGKLETLAKQLRSQEEEIIGSAAKSTQEAAQQAVNGVIQQSMGSIKEMEEQLQQTETEAKEKHRLAEEAMSRALKSQATLVASMRRIRGTSL